MSNETPKPSPKKTKSALKPSLAVLIAGGLALLIVALTAASQSGRREVYTPYPLQLMIGRSSYAIEVAGTDMQKERGLGNRTRLDRDKGMLFPFDSEALQCFWMKDMHFPIDIIWADSGKKVTHIEPDVSPATYPRSYCYPAQYVLELNAGEAARSRLQTGQALSF